MKFPKLYTDGASRGNPGQAGAGAVLFDTEDQILEEKCRYLGEVTNNVAEYQALLMGLDMVLDQGIKEVAIFLDSELIVKQIQGEYRVKDKNLKVLFDQAQGFLQKFKEYTINHVPRAQNKVADQLANLAIDERF